MSANDQRDRERYEFIREYLLALAQGGHPPNLEHDVEHAGKLFDAIYPPLA